MTLSLPLDSATLAAAEEILLSEGIPVDVVRLRAPAIAAASTARAMAGALRAIPKGTGGGRKRTAYQYAIQVLWDWLDLDSALEAEAPAAEAAPEWKLEAQGTGQSLFGTDDAWDRRDALLDSRNHDNDISHKEGGQRD